MNLDHEQWYRCTACRASRWTHRSTFVCRSCLGLSCVAVDPQPSPPLGWGCPKCEKRDARKDAEFTQHAQLAALVIVIGSSGIGFARGATIEWACTSLVIVGTLFLIGIATRWGAA